MESYTWRKIESNYITDAFMYPPLFWLIVYSWEINPLHAHKESSFYNFQKLVITYLPKNK